MAQLSIPGLDPVATRAAPATPPGAVVSLLRTSTALRVTRGDGDVGGWGAAAIKSQVSVKAAMMVHTVETVSLSDVTGSPTGSPCGRSQMRRHKSDAQPSEASQIMKRLIQAAELAQFHHRNTSVCLWPLQLPKYTYIPDVLTSCTRTHISNLK